MNMGDPFGFSSIGTLFVLVPTETPTGFTVTDGASRSWVISGVSFTYDDGIPVSGAITGITYYENSAPIITTTDMSFELNAFFNQLVTNSAALTATIFAGDDTITGSTAFDNLYGYDGNDTLTAGPGGDALRGGGGNDTLNGGADGDFLYGDAGIDNLIGGGGQDLMDGGADNDTLNGGAGFDDLDGGGGDDILNGGDDGDIIRSTSGVDAIDGGAGDDSLVFNRSTSLLAFTINAGALAGTSSVTLADGTTVRNIEHLNITTGAGDDTLDVTSTLILTSYGPNHFNGGAGFDQLTADLSAATVAVGALLTWSNVEQVNIHGGSGDDIITGGSGNDTLIGNGGADRLDGGASENYISGGAGNDILIGGAGTMLGGADDDTMTVYLLSTLQTYTIDGGDGHDRLDFTFVDPTGADLTIGNNSAIVGIEELTLTTGPGEDNIAFDPLDPLNPTGVFAIHTNAGMDRLSVDLSQVSGALTLYLAELSLGSAFTLDYSGVEEFELFAGGGYDNLTGHSNRDILHAGAGADTLRGGEGDDELYGENGDDTLYGEGGVNVLHGGGGDDTIYSVGFDTVDGGDGDDLLVIDHEYDQDNIVFAAGGETISPDGRVIRNVERFTISTGWGDDTLTIIGPLTGENSWNAWEDWYLYEDENGVIQMAPAVEHDRLVIDFSWSDEAIVLHDYFFLADDWYLTTSGVDEFWITGTDGDDYLHAGGRQGDRLIGGAGNDELWSYTGDDYLDGGDGDDELVGFEGNDELHGGAGNDWLVSGLGVDVVVGGAGIDTSTYYFISSTEVSWHRNVDGSWSIDADYFGYADDDTLTGVEILDFTDRDVVLDNAQRTFSGNGTSDFLFRNSDHGTVVIWDVTGGVQNSATVAGGAPDEWTLVGTGDLNGDGKDDLIWRHDAGGVAGWLMDGATATSTAMIGGAPNEWQIAGIGDFNFDGKDDFVWHNSETGAIAVWLLDGFASTSQTIISGAPLEWSVAGIADFDGDGHDDILLRHEDGAIARWTTDGVTQTSASIVGGAPMEWQIAGTGDFDGDGRADILLHNTNDGAIVLWRMNGSTPLGVDIVGAAPTTWHVAQIGDFSGDGKDDILLRHDDGTLALWTMNGGAVADISIFNGVGPEWGMI